MENGDNNSMTKSSLVTSEDIRDLKEILEIEKLSRLLGQLYSATGLANFIVDLKGNILHGVGWQSICTEFHRKNKTSSARCIESDTILADRLMEKEKYSIYICQNGMVDVATPIIIDGVHVANLFIGQFFFETPDKDFFIKQAEELGFDKEKYIQALEECQVYDKESILRFLEFFGGLIHMIGESSLKTIKQKQLERLIEKRAAELIIAEKELAFQNEEKEKRAAELVIADKELAFQSEEKADRAAELVIADEELAFQTGEKADRAAELVIADEEMAFLTGEKADRAAELVIANKELAFQNAEKDKRAAELQRVQILLKSSLESPKDMNILSIDQNYNYYYFNKAHQDAMKSAYGKEVAIGMNLLDAITSENDRINAKFNYDLALQGESHSTIQQYGTEAIGYQETFYNPIINENNQIIGATAFARDVTERMRAEAVLQRQMASQALILEISDNFNNVVAEDIDDIITDTLQMVGEYDHNDRSYVAVFSDDQSTISNTHGWCAEGIASAIDSIRGLPVDRVFPWMKDNLQSLGYTYIPRVADLPPEAQAEKEMMQAQSIKSFIAVPIFMENKILGFLGCDSVRGEKNWSEDNITMIKSVAQIISKAMLRQRFARELLTAENYYRTIFENTGAATMVIEEDLTISRVNEECQRLLGYTKEDLIGKPWIDFIPPDIVDSMKEYRLSRLAHLAAVPLKYQTRIIDRYGNHQDGLLAVDIIPGTNKSVANFIDFTEFNRIDRALKATSAVNRAMIQAENEEDLLRNVCQKILEVGGYSLVGVDYLRVDQQQTVEPVAYAGKDDGCHAKPNITLQDPQRGQGPIATAIRTGQPVVSRDFETDDNFKPWLKETLQQGFKSSMTIPLIEDNKVFGALSVYSSEIGRFDSNEQILVVEMANDLGYAIVFLRNRTEKHQTAQELEKSMEKMQRILMQAVSSLGATLEIRDPYTAGHQRNVARLATAIAEEMDLPRDKITGIAVMGNLHDIGKTNVPSEILSKPGKLSEIEFALIKAHPQAGYEIVKDIEFPWRVAEVLLQHHERMNGSGYPRGLAGEDILMEARIIAVADVVEAMASHRPYRPALNIDSAMEEISHNRDILYDPDVVDACLKLFREKDFILC